MPSALGALFVGVHSARLPQFASCTCSPRQVSLCMEQKFSPHCSLNESPISKNEDGFTPFSPNP